MPVVNIYEAKTHLSRLVKRARAGEDIIIADAGKPVARLVPIEQSPLPRVLGGDEGQIWIADDAFEPMSPGDVAGWEDGGLFPPGRRPARRRGAKPKRVKR